MEIWRRLGEVEGPASETTRREVETEVEVEVGAGAVAGDGMRRGDVGESEQAEHPEDRTERETERGGDGDREARRGLTRVT